jgi:hypothetical protein
MIAVSGTRLLFPGMHTSRRKYDYLGLPGLLPNYHQIKSPAIFRLIKETLN